jgi:hypothetical protein
MARTSRQTTPKARWTRRQYLEDALAQYEAIAVVAETEKSYQAAVRAKEMAAKTRAEIDQFDESLRAMVLPASPEEHRDEVMKSVRRLRASAEAGQSFVAASNLLKLEADLLGAEQARLDALSRGTDTRSAEALFADLQRRFEALPDVLRGNPAGPV